MDVSELAAAAAKSLAAARADVLFGIPGGGNNLELAGAADAAGIRFVLTHAESPAAYLAAVYFELTGRPTGCVVTRGPGAASAVNGMAQALLDRQPLLLFTDAVAARDAPRIAHQRLDQPALFGPVAKWSATLGSAEPEAVVRRAIDLAQAPAPGPVHLDLDPTAGPGTAVPTLPVPATATTRQPGELAEARRILAGARRPALLLGLGSSCVTAEVRRLVAGTNIPVLQTYRAKGVVPDSWPNHAGLLTGAAIEAPILEAADVLIAIGLDSVELIPNAWSYPAPVISLSAWLDTADYFTPSATLVGPLNELVSELGELPDGWQPRFAATARSSAVSTLLSTPRSRGLAPTSVVTTIRAAAPEGVLATVDSGAHMLPVMELWSVQRPKEILISSGLATMGFGLPAAIAAALANPGRRTFCFVGDGGLGMVLGELETVARLNLPITTVVFNDSTLSLIRIKQKPGQGGTNAVGYRPTDFARVAEANGIPGQRVTTIAELDGAVAHALQHEGPTLIDALINAAEYEHIFATIRGRG